MCLDTTKVGMLVSLPQISNFQVFQGNGKKCSTAAAMLQPALHRYWNNPMQTPVPVHPVLTNPMQTKYQCTNKVR